MLNVVYSLSILLVHCLTSLHATEFVCHAQPVNLGISHLWLHQSLMCNEFLVSDDGNAVAHMHPDGDLRFYDRSGNAYFKSYGAQMMVTSDMADTSLASFGTVKEGLDECIGPHELRIKTGGLRLYSSCINYNARWKLVSIAPNVTLLDNVFVQVLCYRRYYDGRCVVSHVETPINHDDAAKTCQNGISIFAEKITGVLSSFWTAAKHTFVMPKILYSAFRKDQAENIGYGWTSAKRTTVGSTPEAGWTWADGTDVESSLFNSTNPNKPLNACARIDAKNGELVETECSNINAIAICEFNMTEYYCSLVNVTARPMAMKRNYEGWQRQEFSFFVMKDTTVAKIHECLLVCFVEPNCGSLTFFPPHLCRFHHYHNDTHGLCFRTKPHANATYMKMI